MRTASILTISSSCMFRSGCELEMKPSMAQVHFGQTAELINNEAYDHYCQNPIAHSVPPDFPLR